FTGKFLEPEIGLIYFGGRWYEPGIGRWVTVDPAEDGENWYSYCVGNPIRYIDISGFGVYRFGEFAVPDIKFDEDFPYDPALKASVRDRLSWIWWGFKAFCASVLRKDLSDAVKAYRHYRSGKGGVLIIDYEKAYKEDQIIRVFVNDEIMSAQKEAERLFRANKNKLSTIFGDIKAFNMLGSAVPVPNGLTENWQKTIGAHFIWGSAFVCINKSNQVTMLLSINVIDKYNFNRGMQDIASKTPDEVNGRFSQLGWAKSFITRGSLFRVVTWRLGAASKTTKIE
ncbi:MAG: RHS repeat-associated core domain-containing protein, partial [Firmicutes bacterium]|nr:RHS repeat-associated core domain-containing protein [Bacillota bacterium]